MTEELVKRIKHAKNFTKGRMPLVLICKDDQELTLMKKTAKGMRGIKNIEFALKEDQLKSYQKGRKEK